MKINVNGEQREVSEGISLSDLLDELKLDPKKVAVEISGDFPDKDKYPETMLKSDDKVEVVRFVGGG